MHPLSLFLLYSLLSLVSIVVAQESTTPPLITSCGGISVNNLTVGSQLHGSMTADAPFFFSTIIAPSDRLSTWQLVVTVLALDLPYGSDSVFIGRMRVASCPAKGCETGSSSVECSFFFFNAPWGQWSGDGDGVDSWDYSTLWPLVLEPPAVPQCETLTAPFAPLVPAQLVFFLYLAPGTSISATRLAISAAYVPLPVLPSALTYVAFPELSGLFGLEATRYFQYQLPPLPNPAAFLDELAITIALAPCAENTSYLCSDCYALSFSMEPMPLLPSLGQNWYPNVGSVIDVAIDSSSVTYISPLQFSRNSSDGYAGNDTLVILSGVRGGCAISWSIEPIWGCLPCNLSSLSMCSTEGACVCGAQAFPNDTYPDCNYNACWATPDSTLKWTGSGITCSLPCQNGVPAGRCVNATCSYAGQIVGYSGPDAVFPDCVWPPYRTLPWWPFPLYEGALTLVLLTAVALLVWLGRIRNWSGTYESSLREPHAAGRSERQQHRRPEHQQLLVQEQAEHQPEAP